MNFFYKSNLAPVFDDTTIIDRLHAFFDKASNAAKAMITSGQIELLGATEQIEHYKIQWVAMRTNQAGRLLGAVIKDKITKQKYFFALDFTHDHNYGATLADNHQRLKSSRSGILEYLKYMENSPPNPTLHASFFHPQPVYQHTKRLISPDLTQAELLAKPTNQGMVCFASAGAGKTFIAAQRGMDYVKQDLKTILLSPTPLLTQAMRQEFIDQAIHTEATQTQFWSFRDYLEQMNIHFPALNLVHHEREDTRKIVNFRYFEQWCKKLKGKPETKQNLSAYWQELNYVIMQPNWTSAVSVAPYLSYNAYQALGIGQSYVSKSQRPALYEKIFAPFLQEVCMENEYYFPPYIAFRLHQTLHTTPLAPQYQFDALVLDEVQKFHPWEWSCLITLLRSPLDAGNFFICGDAHQGVGCQSLGIAASLKQFFNIKHKVDFPVCHLSVNHRNAQAIGRFVAQMHALEHAALGSIERDTHIEIHLDEHEPEGRLQISSYSTEVHDIIERNADAYVLIPSDEYRTFAHEQWPQHQVVTLDEFAGMSAQTIVMFGFSTHFKSTLDAIEQKIKSEAILIAAWNELASFARKSKGAGLELPNERTCLQSIYTAASRARFELLIMESSEKPHRLLSLMVEKSTHRDTLVESISSTPTSLKVGYSSPEEWLNRAEENFNHRLDTQALTILKSKALLGERLAIAAESLLENYQPGEYHAIIQALRSEWVSMSASPNAVNPPQSAAGATESQQEPEANVMPQKPIKAVKKHPQKAALEVIKTQTLHELQDELPELIQKIFDNPTPQQIDEVFRRPKAQIKKIFFTLTMKDDHCLWYNMNLKENNTNEKKYQILVKALSKPHYLKILTKLYKETIQEKPSTLLRLCWVGVVNDGGQGLNQMLATIFSNGMLLRDLVSTSDGLAYFTQYFDDYKETLKQNKIMFETTSEGESALGNFLGSDVGPNFALLHWDFFRQAGSSMHQVMTKEGAIQGSSPFFWLTYSVAGRELLKKKWHDFLDPSLDLLSPKSMHQMVNIKEIQNISAFYWLTTSDNGIIWIALHWKHLVVKGLISSESMHRVATFPGYEKTTALYSLCSTTLGRQLIKREWQSFIDQELLLAEPLNQILIHSAEKKMTSAFSSLVTTPEGQKLLRDKWDDFVEKNLLTYQSFYQELIIDDNKTTAFDYLAATPEGKELIQERYDEFISRGWSSEALIALNIQRTPSPTTHSLLVQHSLLNQKVEDAQLTAVEDVAPTLE